MGFGDQKYAILKDASLLLEADLNGHIGMIRDDAGYGQDINGYGVYNKKGERFIEFAGAHDLVTTNSISGREMNTLSPSPAEAHEADPTVLRD